MTFAYVSAEEAIERRGVRMVVVGNVPSPWGEAAKGILHIKGIEWAAVRLIYDSEALQQWAGQRSGPVLIYNDERPRSGPAAASRQRGRAGACFRLGPRNMRRRRTGLVAPPAAYPRRPQQFR